MSGQLFPTPLQAGQRAEPAPVQLFDLMPGLLLQIPEKQAAESRIRVRRIEPAGQAVAQDPDVGGCVVLIGG